MNNDNNKQNLIAFQASNALPHTKLISGTVLFIFTLVMIPLLAEKYTIDFNFIVQMGGVLFVSLLIAISGYLGRNKIALVIGEDFFEFAMAKNVWLLEFKDVIRINEKENAALEIEFFKDGKEAKLPFNTAFLNKEIREEAKRILKKNMNQFKAKVA
jgi:hypothetical protein